MRFLCLTALALAATTPAQTITRVMPEAASSGDLVIIEGSGLADTQTVDFTANVGGFAGMWTIAVAPESSTPTRVTAIVPDSFGFAPPTAIPPSSPTGSVAVQLSGGPTNSLTLFYLQAELFRGRSNAQSQGAGTTQSPAGLGKAVVSFDLTGGPPTAPNPNFVAEVENAVPGAQAVFFFGIPSPPPFPVIGDGLFVIDPRFPIFAVPTSIDSLGEGRLRLPIPDLGSPGVAVAYQWALIDPGLAFPVAISNALQFIL